MSAMTIFGGGQVSCGGDALGRFIYILSDRRRHCLLTMNTHRHRQTQTDRRTDRRTHLCVYSMNAAARARLFEQIELKTAHAATNNMLRDTAHSMRRI